MWYIITTKTGDKSKQVIQKCSRAPSLRSGFLGGTVSAVINIPKISGTSTLKLTVVYTDKGNETDRESIQVEVATSQELKEALEKLQREGKFIYALRNAIPKRQRTTPEMLRGDDYTGRPWMYP